VGSYPPLVVQEILLELIEDDEQIAVHALCACL
jgi:hypothetical protein